MNQPLTFLFYHYGKIPRYLRNAIEQVRIFNPQAEIMLITDGIEDVSMLKPFGVRRHEMTDFPSPELETFRRTYRHISCFKERYERFVLERWFVTETVRRQRPERTYIMQDSDVAVFGDATLLLPLLPNCPIALSGNNPHFTFVRGDISAFLHFILDFYVDEEKLAESLTMHRDRRRAPQIFNRGEMQFLFEYRDKQEDMRVYKTDTPAGYIDVNLHIPEGFEFMQLRRRPRKKVVWKNEDHTVVPYFLRSGSHVRAFLIHFQGPGKRVFWRFTKPWPICNGIRLKLLNVVFQQRLAANLT
jgi:hypothetical protein